MSGLLPNTRARSFENQAKREYRPRSLLRHEYIDGFRQKPLYKKRKGFEALPFFVERESSGAAVSRFRLGNSYAAGTGVGFRRLSGVRSPLSRGTTDEDWGTDGGRSFPGSLAPAC